MADLKLDAPYTLDFILERKADSGRDDDGSVYIEGYASDFGLDRQDEAFEPNAFKKGMANFMKNPVVLYHHKMDEALGQVTEFDNRPEGLWVKARLDEAEPGTKAADIIRKVLSGTIRGMSVGGRFHRRIGSDGKPRIHTADIRELSLTPMPVNPRTLLAVAGKAFDDDELEADDPGAVDLKGLHDRLTALSEVFDRVEAQLEAKADLSAKGRDKSAAKGHALPDGSYPIETVADLKKAIQAYGRAKDQAAAKAHIIKRAKALGATNLLPTGWA